MVEEKSENMNGGQLTLPWKTRITCFLLSAVTDFSMRSNGALNRSFMKFFEINRKVPTKSPRNLKITDVTVDPSRNLWFRLFVPTQEQEEEQQQQQRSSSSLLPVLIFFHGGGFAYLSPDALSYDVACRRFARESQIIVVSVNYRLSPEHRYPSQYDDGFDVLKFLDQRTCEDFPATADLTRCFLAGDSAGGNLAHHVACRFAASGPDEIFRELNVIGLITIQPWFGGQERTEAEIRLANAPLVSLDRTDWLWKAFLPEGCNRDHEAVNVFGPNSTVDIAGLKKFPATLVVIGGFDPLQDWQRRYYEGLKTRGKEVHLVEYPNAIHAFYIFPELADAPALFAEVKNFIQKHGKKGIESYRI